MNRGLDGAYSHRKRGKWVNICFSDLTDEEMDLVCGNGQNEWLASLAKAMGNACVIR